MEFNKAWIIENGVPIAKSYNGNITLRGLHYRLVALGMTNDINHYKRVINAMTEARWQGLLAFDDVMDRERETWGETAIAKTSPEEEAETAFSQINLWARNFHKNRWENQDIYLEVFIEKKALQGVFERPCKEWDVALNPCKGYPSLTFLWEAAKRFLKNSDRESAIILYFGDHDPSGDDIPRSLQWNLQRMGVSVEIDRIALTKDQVIEWGLPPAPTKTTDTRSRNWDGLGQVELDSVEPNQIADLCERAIQKYFDLSKYHDLKGIEKEEYWKFREIITTKIREEGIA